MPKQKATAHHRTRQRSHSKGWANIHQLIRCKERRIHRQSDALVKDGPVAAIVAAAAGDWRCCDGGSWLDASASNASPCIARTPIRRRSGDHVVLLDLG